MDFALDKPPTELKRLPIVVPNLHLLLFNSLITKVFLPWLDWRTVEVEPKPFQLDELPYFWLMTH